MVKTWAKKKATEPVLNNVWRLAVDGGGQLVVGGGGQLVVGGGWRLVVGGGWQLAVSGWWRLAVGGWWRLAVGPWGLSLRAVLIKKRRKIGALKDSPATPSLHTGKSNTAGSTVHCSSRYRSSEGPTIGAMAKVSSEHHGTASRAGVLWPHVPVPTLQDALYRAVGLPVEGPVRLRTV